MAGDKPEGEGTEPYGDQRLQDFSDGSGGYCVTTIMDSGEEFILSQCMNEGTRGVAKAMEEIIEQGRDVPTIGLRWMTLLQGIRAEMRGMRLTSEAPPAATIIKKEFGVCGDLSEEKTGIAFSLLLNLAEMKNKESQTQTEHGRRPKVVPYWTGRNDTQGVCVGRELQEG
jgi:hypothetical protein